MNGMAFEGMARPGHPRTLDKHDTVHDQDPGSLPPPGGPSPPDASKVQHDCRQDKEPDEPEKDNQSHDPVTNLLTCCR